MYMYKSYIIQIILQMCEMVNPILDGISLLLIHCPSYTDRLVNGYIPLYTTLNLCKLAGPLFAHIMVVSYVSYVS